MPYTKQTWANDAAGGTPLSAARLNYMEDGIDAIDADVVAETTARTNADTTHAGAADPHAGYVLESLIDAAGDLLVGTADNAVGRLAKGAALQVLRVNAGGTALEYAPPASGGGGINLGGGRAGYYFGSPMALGTGYAASASGRLMAAPLPLQACTADRFAIRVLSTTAGAGSVVRVGIYNDDEGIPGTRVAALGTLPVDTTGVKELVVSQVLTAGVYWLAVLVELASGVATLQDYATTDALAIVHSSESGANALTYGLQGYVATVATGALPASYPAAATASSGGIAAAIVRTA